MAGKLILAGTPIGNLGDISERFAQTLNQADFIAAEDTRVTLRLLNHLGIKKPLISYFEHNKRDHGETILRRMQEGACCVLVSDAGMPAISDPGEDLVAQCAERGIPVSVVPGPCAAVSALSVSGLPSGRFCFEGFLSVNRKNRREHLESLLNESRTMIFYEAPHKLRATLRDLLAAFGDRRVALVRELTKIHEEVIRTTLAQAAAYYRENTARGEFVLVVEGRPPESSGPEPAGAEAAGQTETAGPEAGGMEDALCKVDEYLAAGLARTAAVKRAAKETGVDRGALYKRSVSGGGPAD